LTRLFVRSFVLFFATFVASSFAGSKAQDAVGQVQDELIAADRGIWQAIAGARPDTDKVRAALATDYLDVDGGVRHSRDETLQYLAGLTDFKFRYANARAYVLSPEAGYVIAELSYSSVQDGKAASGKVLTTTVFGKEGGRWLAHLHTEMDLKP
jgi:hypothetical protein